jgi:uncharacterized membrane protein
MLDRTSDQAQPPHFSAILKPHRSLSPMGFLLIMSGISIVSFAAGTYFWMKGAWPVFGFFGLDVLLIYVAFKLNYRSGNLYETVTIVDQRLEVKRVEPSGRVWQWTFNPAWVRLDLDEKPIGTAELWLRSGEDAVSVGRFLSDPERREFTAALHRAIQTFRSGA